MQKLTPRAERQKITGRFWWDGDQEKMWIELASITDEERAEIAAQCTKTHIDFPINPKTGKLQRLESKTTDDAAIVDLLLDRMLVDWGNFNVDGRDEFPCTLENKKFLIENVDGFAKFYSESVRSFMDDIIQQYGSTSATKNSKRS